MVQGRCGVSHDVAGVKARLSCMRWPTHGCDGVVVARLWLLRAWSQRWDHDVGQLAASFGMYAPHAA